MRVAIFIVCLLGIADSQVCLAQGRDAQEVPAFSNAIPMVAMTTPGFKVPELAARHVPDAVVNRSASQPPRLGKTGNTDVRAALSNNASGYPPAPRGMRYTQPPERTLTDHLLAGVVGLMLIAYQLRRKHRVLRPHPFAT